MHDQPNWLDIEEQLYPKITMLKQIIMENQMIAHISEYCSEIKYDSFKRQLDLTQVIYKYFIQNSSQFPIAPSKDFNYQITIKSHLCEKLQFLGCFPQNQIFVLGQQFLSQEILHILIKGQEKSHFGMFSQPHKDCSSFSLQQYQYNNQEDNHLYQTYDEGQRQKKSMQSFYSAGGEKSSYSQETKSKSGIKRRTVEQVLKLVADWRKLVILKGKSPIEAAQAVQMSRRSLDDYFNLIKLAQKYGFDFQTKMDCWFSQLRNFVKNKHETKPPSKVQILEKFKPKPM